MPGRRHARKPQPQNLKAAAKLPGRSPTDGAKLNPTSSEDQQLQKEINWCIDQFRLGLMTQKSTQKQMDFTIKLIQTLSSPSAPLVKKRQVMRQAFGDYRKKIADEEAKWHKDAQRLQKASSIHGTSYPDKSVFIRNSNNIGTSLLSQKFASCTVKDILPEEDEKENDSATAEEFRFNFVIPE